VTARRGIWAWLAAIAAGLVIGVTAFKATEADDGVGAGRTASPPRPTGVPTEPSAFARRALTPESIRLYRATGRRLGLDWTVLAAADQIEGGGSPTEESERVAAIAYTLRALGAPDDYRVALEARNGSPRYGREVLRLADRYRSLEAGSLPAAKRPLLMPAAGDVVATYGQRLGILHDGIDVDAPTGTPVRAAAAGLVVSTGFHRVFGEYTCVLHRFPKGPPAERELTTCYGNQSGYAVESGDVVAAGETIGRVGCTGTCVRPHVHFQVRLGAGQTAPVTDPAPLLAVKIRPAGGQPLEQARP
jgi:murein DD-endopeptidase MepM/ murein hydrolase activator NlpD